MSNVITELENLNLVDRFLFDEVMEDQASYQALISILLENEIEILDKTQTEKELRVSPELRQVRLDVVSMDREKKVYFTEMQKQDTGNLRRRSRYYQAQLDVSLLEPGTVNFNLLNDSCFILIAPFDLFKKGLYRYIFEGACRECPELKIRDGAVRIFINTKGTNREEFSQEFLELMEYITASTDQVAGLSESPRIKLLHENVKKIRASEKMGVKYLQKWEELVYARDEGREEGKAEAKDEGRAEGRAEGKKAQLIKQVCKKLKKGKTPDMIAEELEEDLTVIEGICTEAQKYAPDFDCEQLYAEL